jgi:spermidine/putrescine transport system ATP-binding protein
VTNAAVEIMGVRKSFGSMTALEDVDLTVADNEFVSLLGASGCGKSTLLRIVAGFEYPTSGKVRVYGEDVTTRPPERRPTNLVFQRGALFPHMNVYDNIAYSLKLKKWSKKRIDDKVEEMLALVRLEHLGGRGPTELSGGQAQRVALARALAGEPKVLLLDEPMSALDLKLRQQMQLELRAIQRRLEATFVFVTHDQTEALVMSDRIAIMNRGRIVQVGTPQDIYRRPANVFVSDFIGQTNLLRGTVQSVRDGIATLDVVGTRLTVATVTGVSVGARAALSIRPEAVRVSRQESLPEGRGVEGRISEIIYLGSSIRVGAVLADGTTVWADLRDEETEGLAVGDLVKLVWAAAAPTLLLGDNE